MPNDPKLLADLAAASTPEEVEALLTGAGMYGKDASLMGEGKEDEDASTDEGADLEVKIEAEPPKKSMDEMIDMASEKQFPKKKDDVKEYAGG